MLRKDNIMPPKIFTNPYMSHNDLFYYIIAQIGSLIPGDTYYDHDEDFSAPVISKYIGQHNSSMKLTISKLSSFTQIKLFHYSQGTLLNFLLILPMNKDLRKQGLLIQELD